MRLSPLPFSVTPMQFQGSLERLQELAASCFDKPERMITGDCYYKRPVPNQPGQFIEDQVFNALLQGQNQRIYGEPGSGKSVMINHLVARLRAAGAEVLHINGLGNFDQLPQFLETGHAQAKRFVVFEETTVLLRSPKVKCLQSLIGSLQNAPHITLLADECEKLPKFSAFWQAFFPLEAQTTTLTPPTPEAFVEMLEKSLCSVGFNGLDEIKKTLLQVLKQPQGPFNQVTLNTESIRMALNAILEKFQVWAETQAPNRQDDETVMETIPPAVLAQALSASLDVACLDVSLPSEVS